MPTSTDARPTLDLFLGSINRPEKLAAMIESVIATGYPARVLVAAGDLGTIRTCEKYPGHAECLYNTAANRRIGCTAPLNFIFRELVRHDALFCTDDCLFAPDALDIAMTTLYTRFPDTDGVVGLDQDNLDGPYDLAFPLMGKAFLDRFRHLPETFTADIGDGRAGDLFWPGYFHLFNDAEIGLTIKCLGNWVFEPRAKLKHFHPASGAAVDATFLHGLTFKHQDRRAWVKRREAGQLWGIDA